jgi:glycosyltransferase involved in cell wall biosynthesis
MVVKRRSRYRHEMHSNELPRRPRISIVICNHDYAAYLDQAISSALAQDYDNKEVIVVDDGSTDDSRVVIERWADRVIPILKSNGGQISAYNAGFAMASGEIVMFLDSDDFLDREACREVAAAFTGDVVKVHFRLRLVDIHGAPLGKAFPTGLQEGDLRGLLQREGRLYQSSPSSGNAYSKAALDRLMPIPADPNDRHGADFFVVYGVSLLGQIKIAGSHALGGYRIHQPNQIGKVTFGNAAQTYRQPYTGYRRYARLRVWLKERLGDGYDVPAKVIDFSLEKQGYASTIFEAPTYGEGIRSGFTYLTRRMLPAIWARPGRRIARIGLTCWAAAVLVLPRPVGTPIARYVCNPASR